MDIKELESFNLADAVKFHDELNPALWTEKGKLDPEVKDQLMTIAKDFMSEIGVSSYKVEDITISGSNAAYSYTPHSDLDLHILVDFTKLPDDEVYRELFNAKKTLYNDTHDIKVHGVPVELYVQDSNQPHHSLGEYSLLKNEWIKFPKKRRANFDQASTQLKYEKLGELIELALKTKSPKRIEKVLDIIKRYRKAGLEKTGEFGPENLAFKALRKQGLIQKLWDLKQDLHSRELSIEETKNKINFDPVVKDILDILPDAKEIWFHGSRAIGKHKRNSDIDVLVIVPNKTTPDEYLDINRNLYKLSNKHNNFDIQPSHENNMIHRIAKEEGKLLYSYLDALKKTGLDTTDIDPKGHEPMKGQKVDPTYNVGVAEGGAETSWSDGNEKITLQDILELTKHIKQIDLPIDDKLKSKLIHWDGNPEEIERINQVTVSKQFPILVMLDRQGQIDWILDGNHRLHKAIKSQAKTIPAKLIRPSDLDDRTRRVFHIEDQGVAEDYKKVEGGWHHYGLGYGGRREGIQPLPRYNQFATMNRHKEGTASDIYHYMRFLSNKDFMQDVDITGEEIANALAKLGGTNPKAELQNFNKEHNLQLKSWNRLWDFVVKKRTDDHRSEMLRLESASGYIPSNKEKNDPRFKTALTVDIKPDSIMKNAKAFGSKVSRAGIPPKAKTNGKF